MKLNQFLHDVLSLAPQGHNQLQNFLDKEVNSFFKLDSCLKDKHWKKVFNSIMSTEQAFCSNEGPCLVEKENGWKPIRYLILHFRIILEGCITSYRDGIYHHLELLMQELEQSFQLIMLDPQYSKNSLNELEQAIDELKYNSIVRYRSGYKGHSIYFNFKKVDNGILVTINNLGEGLQHHQPHPNLENHIYQKMAFFDFSVQNKQQFQQFIANIIKAKSYDKANALPLIYAGNYPWVDRDYELTYGLFEIQQRTGNCVVKNNLLAVRESCGSEERYQALYHIIKNVTLSNHARHYPNTLPIGESLCEAMQTSQSTFTMQACSAILDKTLIPTQQVGNEDIAKGAALGALGGLAVGLVMSAFSKKEKPEEKIKIIAGMTLFGGAAGAGAGFINKQNKEANNDNFSIQTLNGNGTQLGRYSF